MKPSLVFDLDGTLSDPYEGIEASIRHAFGRLGRPLDASMDLRWCVGPPLLGAFERLLGPEQAPRAPEVLRLFRERYTELGLYENRLYEDIPKVLDVLVSRARLFICTSKPLPFAQRILERFKLVERFEGIHGSSLDSADPGKAVLLAAVLQEHGLDPAATLMIGDREYDVQGALANKVTPVGVLWGYGSREELETAGARRLLEKPWDLKDLV